MTKDEYIGWRRLEPTEQFMKAAIEELDNVAADLINSAGDDPLVDKYRRGKIEGLKWLIEWVPVVRNEEEGDIDAESFGSSAAY